MCNGAQPFPLKLKLQGHCEWLSFSFATISVVIHIITESYSRTQAKDDPIEYSFQRFDTPTPYYPGKQSPALSGLTSVRVCVAGVFMRHPIGRRFERGGVELRSKLHFLPTVARQRCKRSFAVDTLKSMLETGRGKVVNCKLAKSC